MTAPGPPDPAEFGNPADVKVEHQALATIAYRAANRILQDHSESMDVASEAMVTLLARFEPPTNSESYVTTVAKNLAKNRQRGLQRHRRRMQWWADQRAPSSPADPDRFLSGLVVRESIKSLPERQRQAVTYCYLDGFDRRTAAKKMGVEEASVKTHLKRAFKALREDLSDEGRDLP
ncbi:MAG: RNA polymerase sigma factor [Actinomycetota bacterium]